jgi:hypothetical protein
VALQQCILYKQIRTFLEPVNQWFTYQAKARPVEGPLPLYLGSISSSGVTGDYYSPNLRGALPPFVCFEGLMFPNITSPLEFITMREE